MVKATGCLLVRFCLCVGEGGRKIDERQNALTALERGVLEEGEALHLLLDRHLVPAALARLHMYVCVCICLALMSGVMQSQPRWSFRRWCTFFAQATLIHMYAPSSRGW